MGRAACTALSLFGWGRALPYRPSGLSLAHRRSQFFHALQELALHFLDDLVLVDEPLLQRGRRGPVASLPGILQRVESMPEGYPADVPDGALIVEVAFPDDGQALTRVETVWFLGVRPPDG